MPISGVDRLVLDTSAYSHFRSGHAQVLDALSRAERVLIPVTVLGELEAAFEWGSRARENRRALEEGWKLAEQTGVLANDLSAADQQRFDELYLREAEANAQSLERYGIDGMKVFRMSRASVAADGSVTCREKMQ